MRAMHEGGRVMHGSTFKFFAYLLYTNASASRETREEGSCSFPSSSRDLEERDEEVSIASQGQGFGDGITLMVDMVPTQVGGGKGGLGNKALNAAQKKVYNFFRSGDGLSGRYFGSSQ